MIGARLVASSSEERREWEHGMNLSSQPLAMPGERVRVMYGRANGKARDAPRVHASQSRDKVEAPDLAVWSLFGRRLQSKV
jgi:hypothetical protein